MLFFTFASGSPKSFLFNTVIHFYFGADLIPVILVQAFFTEIKSLPKF